MPTAHWGRRPRFAASFRSAIAQRRLVYFELGAAICLSVMDKLSTEHIKGDWMQDYESALDILWHQSVRMNANIYILKKIAEFPFGLFAPPNPTCWVLIADALYGDIIMTAWRILADTGLDVLTLPKLKNRMLKNAKSEASRNFIRARLRRANFDEQVRNSIDLIKQVRNDWLAHIIENVVSTAYANQRGMPIIPANHLISLKEATNDLITALSLDSGRAPTFLEYSDDVIKPVGMDPRSDIEKLLDLIAQNSPLLRMPEDQKEFWLDYRQGLSDEALGILNSYRKKFGLSEA
jgi:hypothetical protein